MGQLARLLLVGTLTLAACGFDALASGPAEPTANDLRAQGDGGNSASGEGGAPDNHDARVGPPACDPSTDPACLALPDGWRLVAVSSGAGTPPACPQGYEAPLDVGANPTPRADACECGACTITQPPSCSGAVQVMFSPNGQGSCESTSTTQSNNPAGQCASDMYTGDATGDRKKYTMPAPSGGACAPGAVATHTDRVDFTDRARVCDGNRRCSGSACDARVDAPYRACFSHPGGVACPAGFAEKHVVGANVAFDCAGTCGCDVATRSCAPVMNVYNATGCMGTPLSIPIDGTCRTPGFTGSYRSYKVVTTPAATCTNTGGNPLASNVHLTAPTTVCCR